MSEGITVEFDAQNQTVSVKLSDECSLEINFTHEGLILDAYRAGVEDGTMAQTYDEWFEQISGETLDGDPI